MNTKSSTTMAIFFVIMWLVAIVGMIMLAGCGNTLDGAGSMVEGAGEMISGIGTDVREAQAGQSGRAYTINE